MHSERSGPRQEKHRYPKMALRDKLTAAWKQIMEQLRGDSGIWRSCRHKGKGAKHICSDGEVIARTGLGVRQVGTTLSMQTSIFSNWNGSTCGSKSSTVGLGVEAGRWEQKWQQCKIVVGIVLMARWSKSLAVRKKAVVGPISQGRGLNAHDSFS